MNDLAVVLSNENFNENCHDYSKNGTNFNLSLDAITKAGFKNIFIQWYNNDNIWQTPQAEQLKKMRERKLNIIFAHLGYQNINLLWKEGIQGEKEVERYKNDIKTCNENNINLVIMHLAKKDCLEPNDLGLKRIKQITNYAKEIGVKIAFENVNESKYVEYVLDRIKDDNVGLCLDSGHYHCFSMDKFDFTKYKNRIFAVHLHDNNGKEDEHKIPGDGSLDWSNFLKHLKNCNYNGPITLELIYYTSYYHEGIYDFYKNGYKKGNELSELFVKM